MSRTVLVTGGSRGIGLAVAQAFVGGGDRVTITGRDGDRLTQAATRLGARAVVADAGEPSSLALLAGHFDGGVDVIVNNAGGFVGRSPAADGDLSALAEHWIANLRVNLLGAVLTVAALEHLIRPGGAVVSIGSIGAEYAANAYSVAKAGVAAWSAGIAGTLGERDITSNVVSPGFIDGTDLFGGRLSDDRRRALVERTHVKRAGAPGDVANLVCFLASDRARHITGQTWHVNGGAFTTR